MVSRSRSFIVTPYGCTISPSTSLRRAALFAETAQRRSNTVACHNGQLHLRLDAAEHLHIGRVEDEFIYIFRVRQCEFDRQIAAVRKTEEVRFFSRRACPARF